MAEKLYRYNVEKDTYELVKPKRYKRLWILVGVVILSAVFGTGIYMYAYTYYNSPREEQLRERNAQLTTELKKLQGQADEAMKIMKDIADRDNNFYRVLMQADPIPDRQRYAGIERMKTINKADSMPESELIAAVSTNIQLLERMLYTQSKSFDYIRQQAPTIYERLDYIPAIQPISEYDMEHLSSGFGYRTDPIYEVTKKHEGMDFAAAEGTAVYATGKGKILFAGWKNGYGNCIDVDHGYNYTTRYGHLSEIMVQEGQEVQRGEQIGKVGNTGKSTGPHLHYEVRYKGEAIDPVNFYFYDITPEQYDQLVRAAKNAGHVMD